MKRSRAPRKYAADIRLPGMLYARILRPPMHGATLSKLDTVEAVKLPGITLVKRGELVAVLHTESGSRRDRARAHQGRLAPARGQGGSREHLRATSSGRRESRKTYRSTAILQRPQAGAARLFETTYHKDMSRTRPRAARGAGRNQGRQGDGLGVDADAFPARDQIAKTLGLTQKIPRDHAVRRRGFGGKSAKDRPSSGAAGTDRASRCKWRGRAAEEFFLRLVRFPRQS